jgi:hypothetical protein
MTSPTAGADGADAILRQVDAEAASTSIEVTLYLPWEASITVRAHTSVTHRQLFTKNDAADIAGRSGALEAEQDRVFIHFRRG